MTEVWVLAIFMMVATPGDDNLYVVDINMQSLQECQELSNRMRPYIERLLSFEFPNGIQEKALCVRKDFLENEILKGKEKPPQKERPNDSKKDLFVFRMAPTNIHSKDHP